jgi:diadenosine tetraphosphate (Ap4A) HIT family hydrolase
MTGSSSPPRPHIPDPSCPFCTISTTYPAPSSSYSSQTPKPDLASTLVSPPAFLVLHSSPVCIAFLDILPLSTGHLLLTTRAHHEKVSEVTDEEARELGRWLRVLSRVLARVTGVWDWNIVQNNGGWIFRFPLFTGLIIFCWITV